MKSIVRYSLVPPVVLAATVAGCGGGGDGGEANAFGDREERATTAPSAGRSPEARLVSALRRGGHVIYFRHTATDWGEDDEYPVDLSDCDTQRNLSATGRRQARAIGDAIERLDVPIGRILSSPFCRALDTARLAFGGARGDAGLENLESAESDAERERRTNRLRHLLSARPSGGTNRVLTGHGYNIQAVADEAGTEEGDADIFRPGRRDGFTLVATVTPAEWQQLAGRFGG
jgi:phosphohistidine phosphatase SixA